MSEFLKDEIQRNKVSYPEHEESTYPFDQQLQRRQAEARGKRRRKHKT